MNVFERYAPFIQDYIYRSGWQSLRAVQNAAGDAIFNTEENVLLTASTASGKTEAAFFPILTLLDENPSRTVGVLYIAPLKALINDQFGRLSELCEEEGIAVTRWHGDARHFADHAGISGIAADQQAHGNSIPVRRSALYRHRRDPFPAAGGPWPADLLPDRAALQTGGL